MCKQDSLLFPQIWISAPARGARAPFGTGEKMEEEKKGSRRALVSEANGLFKRSQCFGGCRLE